VLETLRYEQFSPLAGTIFHLVEKEQRYDLQLVSVGKVMESQAARLKRNAFSLFFLGPHEPIFEQRIYTFEHDTLGTLEFFIVPVGHDAAGMLYEAVFT
jgi:hypothetical protein